MEALRLTARRIIILSAPHERVVAAATERDPQRL